MPAPLPDRSRAESISTLQALLPLHLGLYLAAKQAHWAVRGSLFLQLHKLFDKVAKTAANGADTIAERIRQLGGETTPVTTDPLIPGTDGSNSRANSARHWPTSAPRTSPRSRCLSAARTMR
ncbi:MAG TPA: ferritin-like domain-containing protein [Thauera aminoaromatica]|nr:ferritin-like domain-containing protein [Thauera aminoaromatica]